MLESTRPQAECPPSSQFGLPTRIGFAVRDLQLERVFCEEGPVMSTRILVAICAMLCFATGVVDAQFTYSASGGSGIAGSSVGNMVMLDNSQDV